MRKLAVVVIAILVAGCASHKFQAAIDSGDPETIEAAMHDLQIDKRMRYHNPGLFDPGPGAYKKMNEEAVRILSEKKYKPEFLELVEEDHVTVSFFDSHCNNAIGQLCSDETRRDIQRIEEEVRQRKALARQQELEKIRQELVSGKREISSLFEAELAFQPVQGDQLLFSPHVDGGDGQYYRFSTYITAKRGEHYISWWPDAGIHYQAGAVILKPKAMYGDIRFGSPTGVVGKYVGNRTIPLANGGQAVVPVFAEAYVSGGR